MTNDSAIAPVSAVDTRLARPRGERAKEFKYRFAQCLVFGLPVLGLQRWGPVLGGHEAGRWVGILQALLSGWVLYTAAAGMLFEGLVRLSDRKVTPDLIVAGGAAGLYFFSAARVIALVARGDGGAAASPLFHWVVLVLALWSAVRWWWLARPRRGGK